MNSSRKGNAGELRVASALEREGYCVGLRRNRRGGGDLLAVRVDDSARDHLPVLHGVRLVEVKASKRSAFANFPPADRREMIAEAERVGGRAELAWTPSPGRIQFIGSDDWP